MAALVLRGQVYRDLEYTYPDGGPTADKYIIVLNKNHLPTQPIIVVPTTTFRGEERFSAGCKSSQEYHLPANQDCFADNTIIQLFVLGLVADIAEDVFKSYQQTGRISKSPVKVLHPGTIAAILACVKTMKEDVRQNYYTCLF